MYDGIDPAVQTGPIAFLFSTLKVETHHELYVLTVQVDGIVSMLLPSWRHSLCVLSASRRISRPCVLSRTLTTLPSSAFAEIISRSTSKHQIYQSYSSDPFVNLSIEQHLLQKTPEDSNVLFLYVNRPCVVVGRNQNPWLETNLKALQKDVSTCNDVGSSRNILYVRRHSGGGAVFHDFGNLNYSVICPRDVFTRDRHAEMVARALQKIGAVSAMVNERHDIVLTQQPREAARQLNATGVEDPPDQSTAQALKVSGSAFKLTRNRALHHGTCLLDSPNIDNLGAFLRSPARPYIHAKGVSSVRSPVGNVSAGLLKSADPFSMHRTILRIVDEFAQLYGTGNEVRQFVGQLNMNDPALHAGDNWVAGSIGDAQLDEVPDIRDTVHFMKVIYQFCLPSSYFETVLIDKIQSTDFRFLQTPEFTFSTFPTEEDNRTRPPLPSALPQAVCLHEKKISPGHRFLC